MKKPALLPIECNCHLFEKLPWLSCRFFIVCLPAGLQLFAVQLAGGKPCCLDFFFESFWIRVFK